MEQCQAIAQQKRVDVCIVGGGLEGVESLGEILRRYGHIEGLTIHLIESSDQRLPGLPASLSEAVQRRCRNYSVCFHTGTRVQAVGDTIVELDSGQVLPADITIWTGGATAPDLLTESELAPRAGSWPPVKATLQSRFSDHVFIVGDAAELPRALNKQAYYASDMGVCATANVTRYLANEPLEEFQPSTGLSLISLGNLDTYLVTGKTVAAGTVLSAAKEFVYQFNMARYEPPLSPPSFLDLQARFWRGVFELGLPNWLSPRALLRLDYVRLLNSWTRSGLSPEVREAERDIAARAIGASTYHTEPGIAVRAGQPLHDQGRRVATRPVRRRHHEWPRDGRSGTVNKTEHLTVDREGRVTVPGLAGRRSLTRN